MHSSSFAPTDPCQCQYRTMNTSQQAIPSIPSATGALGSRPYLSVDFADGDILLVDRTRAQAEALVARLGSSSRLPLRIAGADPLAEALARPPKLVLLATDASGEVPQFLQQLRWHSPIRHIPVVAIADSQEAAVRIRREQLDVQGVVARSARLQQVASQVAAVRLAGAAWAERAHKGYETLMKSMPDGFCIVKVLFDDAGRPRDYRFLLVNAAFERTTGLNAAQGKLMRDLAPAHEEYWFELYGQVATTGEPLHLERAAERLQRWYQVNAMRYGRPEDHEVAIFFKDITARKQAEEERQKAVSMLQAAMRLGRIGAWSFDTTSQQVQWSQEARAIHEVPQDLEVSLETAVALIDETARPYVHAAVQACITTGAPFDLEASAWTFLRKPLWIRLIGEAVRDARGAIVRIQGAVQDITDLTRASKQAGDLRDQLGETLESMRDISERKRAENDGAQAAIGLTRRVRERTTDLENAYRELKEFSQALAHDIRGPIGAIGAFAHCLARDLALGESGQARQYVDRILQGVHRVNEYTDALLSLVRVSYVQMQPKDVDLSVLAQDIVDELRARNPHRDVLVHVAPDLRAHGDSMLLRMALQNLLANAWKFTGRKSKASVSFRAERTADGAIVYQVRDNGAGFDPSQRPRLFGNFQRLHGEDEFPGTGIGLASVHRIISRHGGQVWAEGAVNEGATFYFTLGNARAGTAELSPDAQVMAR